MMRENPPHLPFPKEGVELIFAAICVDAERKLKEGKFSEVIMICRKILAIVPDYADGWHIASFSLCQAGTTEEGISSLDRAIKINPEQVEYRRNRSLILQFQSQKYAENYVKFGIISRGRGEVSAVVKYYRHAIVLVPSYALAWNNLAIALIGMKQLDEAIILLGRVICLEADAEAYANLGSALQDNKKYCEAKIACYKAIEMDHLCHAAYSNLSIIHDGQEAVAMAQIFCRKAIIIAPDNTVAFANSGNFYRKAGQLDEAVSICRRSIILEPNNSAAHVNLSMALLSQKKYRDGWSEYDWRWYELERLNGKQFSLSHWLGDEGHGRTMLIYAEQGFGDNLQFCRFIPMVSQKGWRVILRVRPPLLRLLENLPGVAHCYTDDDIVHPYDAHCPMASLPRALGIDSSNISVPVPYLKPNHDDMTSWKMRLANIYGDIPLVGLVWHGSPTDKRRSMPVESLSPLFSYNDVAWFSLQKDSITIPDDFPLVDVTSEIRDFADMAALVANLDLVITIDTAMAHLAGALGVNVWLLSIKFPDWRWYPDVERSLWYPSMRIFRQTSPGDWDGVVSRVRRAIEEAHWGEKSPLPTFPKWGSLLPRGNFLAS